MKNNPTISEIQKIVGPATEEQIRFIDCYVFEDMGIFLPVAGPCYYSLSPEHVHPSYMVIYSFSGESEGWVNGIEMYGLKPGHFLFMAPNIKHQENEGSDTPRYLAVMILPSLIEPILEEYYISVDEFRSLVTTTKASKQFLPLCWQFIGEMNNFSGFNKSLLKAISVQICHVVIRSLYDKFKQNNNGEWRMEIGHSIAFIHSNLHEKIGLSDIARQAGMSVPNFSRAFKKETNQTPIEYLQEKRLYKAQSMLFANEFSMQDIASACGFSSISYFSTTFRKKFQVSPEKYKLTYSE